MPLCFITVRGVDYQAADPLVAIFTQGSAQGGTKDVIVTILNDEAVEGNHQFTAAVEPLSPVIAGPGATIVIVDNDSEYYTYMVVCATAVYVRLACLHVYTYMYMQLHMYTFGKITIIRTVVCIDRDVCMYLFIVGVCAISRTYV